MKKFHSAFLALAILLCGPAATRAADEYPSHPVRLVVPAPPGSGIDAAARIVTQKMEETLGAPIVIENRPGASGQIGSAYVARSKPDGYTLLLSSSTSHSAAPFLYKQLPYDAINDFTSVGRISFYVYALFVKPSLGISTPAELAEYARRKGSVSYAYGNSLAQIAGALFSKSEKLNATGVAYKGTPPALTDVVSGVIDFMFADWAAGYSFASGGLLRPIGTLSSEKTEMLPESTPMGAQSDIYTLSAWSGISGPSGLPSDIVAKLNAALNKALADETVKQKLSTFGMQASGGTPAEFDQFVRKQLKMWGEKIAEVGITPE